MNWRPIVLVILLIGVGAAIYFSFMRGPSMPPGYQYEERPEGALEPGSPGAAAQAPAAKVEQVEKNLEREKVFVYSRAGLRNPMAPYVRKPEPGTGAATQGTGRPGVRVQRTPKLEGIMWSSTRPLAIIDGNVMGVGESLKDGSKVTEIGKRHVVLKRGTSTVKLVLE
jgi:hypothetical protein